MAEINMTKESEKINAYVENLEGKTPTKEESKDHKLEPVTSATLKKETGWTKFKSSFIVKDVKSVGLYLWEDILIPTVKSTISDIVSNGIDNLLYGDDSRNRRNGRPNNRSNASYVSYNSCYRRDDRRDSRRDDRDDRRSKGMRTDYIIEDRREAEQVIDRLRDAIDMYGMATLDDLKDLIGEPGDYTDRNWGWTNLRDAGVIRVRDGYELSLPRLESLK